MNIKNIMKSGGKLSKKQMNNNICKRSNARHYTTNFITYQENIFLAHGVFVCDNILIRIRPDFNNRKERIKL